MKKSNFIALLYLFLFSLGFAKENLDIGIIYDSRDEIPVMKKLLEKELEKNFNESDYNPRIIKEIVSEEYDFNKAMTTLNNDKEVDSIITMGILGSEDILGEKSYKKTTVSPFGILPYKEKDNLIYITEEMNILKEIQFMEELIDIKKIVFYIPDHFRGMASSDDFSKEISTIKNSGYEAVIVYSSDSADKIKSSIKESSLIYIVERDHEKVSGILEQAEAEKIPTFVWGADEKSANASLLSSDFKREAGIRVRAGIANLRMKVSNATYSNTVDNIGKSDKNIKLNMKVAQKLGVHPNFIFKQKVELIEVKESSEETLNLLDGIKLAIGNNPDIKSRKKNITVDEFGIKSAKSDRRPHVGAFAEYNKRDSASASSEGTPAENSMKSGISLNYLLFDDNVNANIKMKDLKKQSTEERYRQENLDITNEFGQAYLTILELDSKLKIERYNYKLMKEFHQIARTKYEIGESGPEDIYRFESEMSDSLTNIAEITALKKIAETDMNKIIGVPVTTKYLLSSVDINSDNFKEFSNLMNHKKIINDNSMNFFIKEGVNNSPEIKQIDFQIAAKERELKAAKRERYLPKVNAFGEWTGNTKDDWGNGSDNTSEKDDWNIGTRVELPLFEGGNITYRQEGLKNEIDSLSHQKKSIENNVSERVSNSFTEVKKNYIQISTTKESLEASKKNFELVTDFYAKGKVSISDLLDARTTYISADEVETVAKYSYLKSVIKLERSIGEYFMLMDDITKQVKLNKLNKNI